MTSAAIYSSSWSWLENPVYPPIYVLVYPTSGPGIFLTFRWHIGGCGLTLSTLAAMFNSYVKVMQPGFSSPVHSICLYQVIADFFWTPRFSQRWFLPADLGSTKHLSPWSYSLRKSLFTIHLIEFFSVLSIKNQCSVNLLTRSYSLQVPFVEWMNPLTPTLSVTCTHNRTISDSVSFFTFDLYLHVL